MIVHLCPKCDGRGVLLTAGGNVKCQRCGCRWLVRIESPNVMANSGWPAVDSLETCDPEC